MSARRVVHLVESLGLGGLERVVQTLARLTDPARFRVEVFCAARGGPLQGSLEAGGTPVRVLGLNGYYPPDILATARALRRSGADLVHTHGHFAGVLGRAAAWWAGIPVLIHHLHTVDATLQDRHLRLERFLGRLTDRILCCSRAVESHALEILRLPRLRTLTIYNGIEPPPEADRAQALGHLGRTAAPPIVGCIGGLNPHKGQEVLIRACALLSGALAGATLVLVGDGPDRPRLEALAAECGLGSRAIFLGERADARRLLPAFDVAVVPSVEREGLGLAALEAMDASRPVIACRVGGLPEAVEDGVTGVLVEPRDPAALAAAIGGVLGRPDRGRSLGVAGRRRVETLFRAATMARRVEAIYEEALRERRAA
jgi:glycosyltransferase involved in cell wall biosynthesis